MMTDMKMCECLHCASLTALIAFSDLVSSREEFLSELPVVRDTVLAQRGLFTVKTPIDRICNLLYQYKTKYGEACFLEFVEEAFRYAADAAGKKW